MDKPLKTVLDDALRAAPALGLDATLIKAKRGQGAPDGVVEIGYGGHRIRYAVETKRALTPSTLGNAIQQVKQLAQPALLVTDYATPPVAERLREADVEFLDGAGNAFLKQPPLLVWVKGQRPAAKPVAPEVGRAFQPGGLQVLFALLSDPAAVALPYRELARRAGVAHGTVGWVMADLQEQGFVSRGPGIRRLFDRKRLLTQWIDAYARLLRPRTLLGRYYVTSFDGWKDWPLQEHGALWGSEPAAAIATGYLRPGELTFYVDKVPGLLLAKQRLYKTSEAGRTAVVEVRRRFWDFPGDPQLPGLVPPLLIYADLLATGDGRCIETAQMVYDEHLARLFQEG